MTTREEIEREADDQGMIDMIGAAVEAGSYRAMAREHPGHEGGFWKMAAKYSRRVEALADEICRENATARIAAPSPCRVRPATR